MQYKGNFHDGSTEEGKRFVEELWFIFCFIYKQEMRFIQLYMQIHWSLIVCYDILHNVVLLNVGGSYFRWLLFFRRFNGKERYLKDVHVHIW